MTRPIVLDVDTGVDDALALMLAARHPSLDLRGVSCVGGNAALDDVVRNTLSVLQACGRHDVPVAAGAQRPLLEQARRAAHVHGHDGMGDLGWPEPTLSADSRHGVELLRDLLLQAGKEAGPEPSAVSSGADPRITLVPLAPLTNIALLLRTWPQVAAGLRQIVFMGGSAGIGNATASAEFNVWHDPEAAAIVLQVAAELDVPVVMYGLDVFYDVRVSREQARDLVAGPAEDQRPRHDAAELAGRLVGFQCDRFGQQHATIGDAGAVCAVIEPEGLTTERLPVQVELAGAWSRGTTVVDRRSRAGRVEHEGHGASPAMVDVAVEVTGDRYTQLWLETITGTAGHR